MSRREHIENLIINYRRRLEKLEERQALEGLSIDPKVLIEIEDIEKKISELETKRDQLASKVKPPNDPFHYGGPVPPEKFIGHRWAVDFCRSQLTTWQSNNITISGERRIGKTSLLHYLREYATSPEWGQYLALYLDLGILSGAITPTNFWKEILRLLQASLDDNLPLTDQINELRNQADVTVQDFCLVLDNYHNQRSAQSIILLLDEFELMFQFYNSEIETLLKNLKAITSQPTNEVILITSTRDNLPKVCRRFTQATELEFQSNFVSCELKPFDKEETKYVIQTFLSTTNVVFSDVEIDYIWKLSQWQGMGALPIFVQVAAHLTFERKLKGRDSTSYHDLRAKFNSYTDLYRTELSDPQIEAQPQHRFLKDVSDYKHALVVLENALSFDNSSELIVRFYLLRDQLWQCLRINEVENNADVTLHRDFRTIIDELSILSLEITGQSFTQLAANTG